MRMRPIAVDMMDNASALPHAHNDNNNGQLMKITQNPPTRSRDEAQQIRSAPAYTALSSAMKSRCSLPPNGNQCQRCRFEITILTQCLT